MPLIMADTGKPLLIKKIGGKEDCRKFLESLGLVPGATISIISKISGNIIIQVKESRIAVNKELASKIIV
ncbi:MAG: ferrous iron transport protein A [Spirochaetes bacterium]|uniref:Ferrous iron transport protein A n=1 Tax=Candidatus Gallitreponema excrementavium TaxID=2840840 RepID=A0A9D9HR48_9SPIR|nr:ferrous iron transport protein A [Candidatus Gallitreponema excrementavium]